MKLLYSSYLTTHTRYLFQAQEMDNEIKGDGNSVNYKYRMHDPRLGRFFAVDPMFKDFPSNSSYAFSENNVIHAVELEGLEKVHVYNKWMDSKGDMQSKYSHTYIDKRLKENINQVNSYNAKGDIASKTYKSKNTSVKIKAGTEYKNDFTQFFDSEKSGFTSIDTRSMPDAMRHDSWEGGDDGANTGGKYNGVTGMRNAASDIDNIGDGLSYIPTPFTQVLGKILQADADILNSIADFNEMDTKKAALNTAVRLVTFGVDKKIGDKVKKAPFSNKSKYMIDQTVRKTLDNSKDALIIKKDKK